MPAMPSPIRANGLRPIRLPRSPRVLLLVDFINPLDFPGAEKLANRRWKPLVPPRP